MVKLHVLVVDDDEEFRAAMREALGAQALVTCVATPMEALWLMERVPVDVLLCDMVLATTTTGGEVLEIVREQWPRIGRILVTGHDDHLRRRDLPAHAVLLKPLDLVALRDLIRLLPTLAGAVAASAEA